MISTGLQTILTNIKYVIMRPMTIALVLSCISTAIKTAAWYGQTIIPDNFVLPSKWSPSDPNYREIAITTLKILLSWAIAIFEYLPLTMANSVADKAKIKLTNLRGAIEAMDLAWFVLFIYFAKHARLNWHQYVGLALAGIGCAIVNKPDWLFPKFDANVEKLQNKIGANLSQKILQCFKNSPNSDQTSNPEKSINSLDITADFSLNQKSSLDNPDEPAENETTTSSLSIRIFFIFWIAAQVLFYILAVLMFIEKEIPFAVLSLSASATGVKTIAWYLHTVLGDRQLLPPSLTPKTERAKRFSYALVKVVMSWLIALFEYIPLTVAHRTADMNAISLAKVRGAIEAMDLLWLVSFMMMVRGENLRWQHLMGLTVAGLGVAIANTDVDS